MSFWLEPFGQSELVVRFCNPFLEHLTKRESLAKLLDGDLAVYLRAQSN
jgi:hypothetical protein